MRGPGLVGVLETVLYHDSAEREAVERFYGDALGLTAVARWEDGIAFRIGGGVLLLFDLEQLALRAGPIADHGTSGPGHACLQADGADDLERWRELLKAAGVEILHDHDWGGRLVLLHGPGRKSPGDRRWRPLAPAMSAAPADLPRWNAPQHSAPSSQARPPCVMHRPRVMRTNSCSPPFVRC